MDYVEELIRTYIHLPTQPASTGWYPILCLVCNDHGRKGPRAAFRFDDEGVAYHCFNCGHKCSYYPHFKKIPKDMAVVFNAFDVPEEEINKLRLASLQERDESGQAIVTQDKRLILKPDILELPNHFTLLSESTSNWAEIARYYLEDRKIDPTSYPFYISTGNTKPTKKWTKRVIIPIYRDNHLVFYQGRDLTGKALKKYESPSTRKDRVIFGFDQLFTNEDRPLYVVEGFFDAFPINGVALLGNELTEPQVAWLNRSRRDKVYIPDKFGDGARNAEKALENGWRIALPDIGDCKDINDAIIKYGQLYVHNTLRENTLEGFQAEASLKLYCK